MKHLQYPIGEFEAPTTLTSEMRSALISDIESLPRKLEAALVGITEKQLETPYRPAGWTVRQVVHHIADSHTNAHIRLRCALTESAPTIKPYNEGSWATLSDYAMPIDASLAIIRGLHERWVNLLKSLQTADFQRTYVHPAYGKVFSLDVMTALYAWHSNHHLAHVKLVVG